jgi:CubicO group peptidase (beta-lactamase class C family)
VRSIIRSLLLCSLFVPTLLFASGESPVSSTISDAASLTAAPSVSSQVPSPLSSRISTLDLLLQRAISQNLIAGGVVVIGNHEGILSTSARGRVSADPGSALLNEHTVFDIASLTKVIATAPAIMKLLDEGRITLSDPLSRWFPEFAAAGHGDITILNLLTHTSGLDDITLGPDQSMETAVRKAAAQNYKPGTVSRFHYADINFILLGELVRRVSGQPLDAFCHEQIYGPLGARDTMFLPPHELNSDIAPTAGYSSGVVQDPNARRLGGVAGHAGLFSSAYDLSRFARLMLNGGKMDDKHILSEQIVAQMTTPYLCNNGRVRRGLGWDMASPYSAPKGSFFSDSSFGHTGYSGTSIWIDPQQDLFVILLTRRTNYYDVKNFNQLRRDVSTIASADFKAPGDDGGLNPPWEVARISARLNAPVQLAITGSSHRTGLVALSRPKWQHQQRVFRRSAKAERSLAKAGSTHRLTRFARIARADKTCKTTHASKKRRTLRKG